MPSDLPRIADAKPGIPVILVHGIGSHDKSVHESRHWGRIPDALKAAGHPVLFGNQDAWGTVETNAVQLASVIEQAASLSEAGKVIVVAHSKGGLDVQAARRLPSIDDKVALVITLSSPHNGMRFCDALLRSRIVIPHIAAKAVNAWARLRGDANPDSYGALRCLGTQRADLSSCQADAPAADGADMLISVGVSCNKKRGAVASAVSRCDGANDGLVSLSSTQAGTWLNAQVVNEEALGCHFQHEDCTDRHGYDFEIVVDGIFYPSIVELVCSLVERGAHMSTANE